MGFIPFVRMSGVSKRDECHIIYDFKKKKLRIKFTSQKPVSCTDFFMYVNVCMLGCPDQLKMILWRFSDAMLNAGLWSHPALSSLYPGLFLIVVLLKLGASVSCLTRVLVGGQSLGFCVVEPVVSFMV